MRRTAKQWQALSQRVRSHFLKALQDLDGMRVRAETAEKERDEKSARLKEAHAEWNQTHACVLAELHVHASEARLLRRIIEVSVPNGAVLLAALDTWAADETAAVALRNRKDGKT